MSSSRGALASLQSYSHCNCEHPSSPRSPAWETPPSPSSCWTPLCHVEKWEAEMSNTGHKAEPVLCLVTRTGGRASPRTLWSITACQGHSPTLPHSDLCVTTAGSHSPRRCRNPQEESAPALYRCALSVSRLTFQKMSAKQPLPSWYNLEFLGL